MKCNSKTLFKVNKPLIYSIQKITGHHTHQIMNFFAECLNEMTKDFEIDLSDSKSTLQFDNEGKPDTYSNRSNNSFYGYTSYRGNARKTFKYPDTEVFIKCAISLEYTDRDMWVRSVNEQMKKNTMILIATFSTSSAMLTITEEQMSDIQAEGELLDISEDVEERKFRDSITPKQLREEHLKKELERKAKEAEKLKKKRERELQKEQEKLQKQLKKLKTKTESNIL